jgi:uncharacterized protein (DUF1684 family)
VTSTGDDPRAEAQAEALRDVTTLMDWRRRVFDLYRDVRADSDPQRAWRHWREVRNELFSTHAQSPVPPADRAAFAGARYYDYDPRLRFLAELVTAEPLELDISTSRWSSYRFTRFATVALRVAGRKCSLDCFWLQGYGGGLFLPFGDATNSATTYGGARYLLDTVKGSDLGTEDEKLVLDFNFAYNPSCAYDPRWVCPLAPAGNRLPVEIEAGEQAP